MDHFNFSYFYLFTYPSGNLLLHFVTVDQNTLYFEEGKNGMDILNATNTL